MRLLIPLLAPLLLAPRLALGADSPDSPLPLRDIALFSSGVGYFGRVGEVTGNATVPLTVRAPQISDLLKSLVLFDSKGSVRPVTYSLQDYVSNRTKETDLNLGSAASPGALLQAFQGARVRLEKPLGAVEGLILSVSSRQVKVDESYLAVEHLSILTDAGVQTVRLDDVQSFRLLDPNLDAKLRATLEKKALSLTQKLDDGARNVTLRFEGKGKREVRAGYLLETPAWKTSYRLVLDAKKKPYLQGWAVVENTTDEDWRNVSLSLISGRPISFIQDLATPVYVTRTIVPPQIIGSTRPQTFGEGFSLNATRIDALDTRQTTLENRVTPPPRLSITPSILHRSGYANYAESAAGWDFLTPSGADIKTDGAQSQAQGAERGELFEYAIDGATTLGRGEAAMVPIVSSEIGGEAISIVSSSLQKGEIAASNGFFLRNTSGLHLQGGPITVFAAGIYAGDALIPNLGPRDARLIAYARDLELVAMQNDLQGDYAIKKLSIKDGVLHVISSSVQTRSWNFKNKSGTPKSVLLQVPDEAGWELNDPKQLSEKTADGQRFRLTVAPGETKYSVKWTRQNHNNYILLETAPDDLASYLLEKAISPTLKAKLASIIAERNRISTLVEQRSLQEAALKDIEADQARIRANMEPLDKNGKLFKSYEAKLGSQEDRIEKVRAEITRLREAENSQRAELKSSLEKLTLE